MTWKPRASKPAKFLDAGDKVKLTVLFRGREMAHPDIGKGLLDQLADQLATRLSRNVAAHEGRTMILIMAPLKAKAAAVAEKAREKEG